MKSEKTMANCFKIFLVNAIILEILFILIFTFVVDWNILERIDTQIDVPDVLPLRTKLLAYGLFGIADMFFAFITFLLFKEGQAKGGKNFAGPLYWFVFVYVFFLPAYFISVHKVKKSSRDSVKNQKPELSQAQI